MPTVELVYDSDCPNVADARAQLLRAFAETKLLPRWQEWQGDAADSHPHVRGYGSPTILVDGVDVVETEKRGGPCCRLYAQPDGSMRGVPSVETLVAALKASAHAGPIATSGGENWKLNFAMLPGIGAAFLPKVACPACWPAYAGFLSSIGLGFLVETTYLLPLTGLFLAVAVFALAFRARRRRGHGPFVLGAAASAIVLIGKFSFESNPAMYAGLALLIAASLWNSWPRRGHSARCWSGTTMKQVDVDELADRLNGLGVGSLEPTMASSLASASMATRRLDRRPGRRFSLMMRPSRRF